VFDRDSNSSRIEKDKEALIMALLKKNQNGLSISEISSHLNLNRNSTSKYLQLLETKGCIERCSTGRTKLYYLPRRPPVSALLSYSSELICTFDALGFLTFANEKFFHFFGLDEPDSLYVTIGELSRLSTKSPLNIGILTDLVEGTCQVQEYEIEQGGVKFCLRAKGVKTTFEDDSTGVTILIEDNTAVWKYRHNLEFIAQSSAKLATMNEEDDIYQYIADRIFELEPRSHVLVSSIHPMNMVCVTRACAGEKSIIKESEKKSGSLLGRSVSMEDMPWMIPLLSQCKLVQCPDSLYNQTNMRSKKDPGDHVQENLSPGACYTMGFVCQGGLYGNVTIRLRNPDDLQNLETIETFVKQLGIALQRRYLREQLKKVEEKVLKIEEELLKLKARSKMVRVNNR